MSDKNYDAIIDKLRLNAKTSEPYYQQLRRKILSLIANGTLSSGINLPSERVLAEELNISRTTVRRCYEELRAAGHLDSFGRNGTAVKQAPHISPIMGKLQGFTEEMRELGMVASTRVLAQDVVCDRNIANIFNRPATASFLRLERVRYADNVPMTHEIAWYDLTLAPCMEHWDTAGSAYAFLQNQCKLTLHWAEQSVEAVLSTDKESNIFGFENSSPCLLLKRKSYTALNQLVEYVEGTFRGDAYAYRVKLHV